MLRETTAVVQALDFHSAGDLAAKEAGITSEQETPKTVPAIPSIVHLDESLLPQQL